ncbi:MAG: aminotransferase class V-fold PLP-dependent enzyme, partial [Acidobacteriota bacterium]|nr:aminotransferase class V-fold PLP-dependent enzyme [Acidobacteriota bacterium]
VVISDLEFPSGVLAWLSLRPRGVTVRLVPSDAGRVSLESFQSAINENTRVVCVSDVSYKTGSRLPFLRELSRAAHAAGAILAVDATQSLGRLPVLLDGVDFLAASAYKWLLGIHGVGVAYLAPALRERLVPGALGWYSVPDVFTPDRFDHYDLKPGAGWLTPGMPAFPSIYVLRGSVEFLLDVGVDRIERDLRPLTGALREGIASLGFDLLTPADPARASGIVSFLHPDCDRIGEALKQRGVIVWTGDGRVRASVHLYNDQADVDRFLQSLAAIHWELSCVARS